MSQVELLPNLFRTEFSKIVSVLCNTFGISNIELAEDLASDTFLVASETWSLNGIPDHPKAWLYSVAKNKAKDFFKRESIFSEKVVPLLSQGESKDYLIDLSEKNIEDSQLKMIFTVCNPILTTEAQITLALRVLCGFGIEEIASALLTSKSTINKRLLRAKSNFKKHDIKLELPLSENLKVRQSNVLTIMYLLFNEGYYSSTTERKLKKHLCLEAMRLLYLFMTQYDTPEANALMALFCFHSSRFEAREDDLGHPILYENQDRDKWSKELILKGEEYLHRSATGENLSTYHLEASIAFWHAKPEENVEKWENILQIYNKLLQISYSPIAALNRTYALSKARSKEDAITEALKIDLDSNHLYHSLLAELYNGLDSQKEEDHLKIALTLAKSQSERIMIEEKIAKNKSTSS